MFQMNSYPLQNHLYPESSPISKWPFQHFGSSRKKFLWFILDYFSLGKLLALLSKQAQNLTAYLLHHHLLSPSPHYVSHDVYLGFLIGVHLVLPFPYIYFLIFILQLRCHPCQITLVLENSPAAPQFSQRKSQSLYKHPTWCFTFHSKTVCFLNKADTLMPQGFVPVIFCVQHVLPSDSHMGHTLSYLCLHSNINL